MLKNYHQSSLKLSDFNKSASAILASLVLQAFIPNANAAVFSERAIVTTTVEYDSNPSLSANNEQPVWAYTIVPQLQIDATNELNRWYLDSALLVHRYSNEKVLVERQDPKISGGWTRTYESGTYGIKANYEESTSRNLELASTGVFVNKNGTQKNESIEALWQHAINARWSILNEGIYSKIKITNSGVLGSYDLSELRSTLTYANTEKLSTYSQLDYLHYRPESILDNTDFIRLNVGANYQMTERFSYGVRGGLYKVSGNQSDTGWEAAVNGKYTPNDKTIYLMEVSRSLGAGGIGGFQKNDSLKLAWNYDLSDRNIMGADYSLNMARKDNQINTNAVNYQQINLFYDRKLSNHWQARLSAAHKQIDVTNVNSQANVIGVALKYDTLSF